MSHNLNKLGSDWWLVLLSSLALAVLVGAHVGSFTLGWASGARWSMGGPAHERTTLAALCYSHRQHSAQPWQNRAAVHSQTFLVPAPWAPLSITPPKHWQASLTGTKPPNTHPTPSSNTDRLPTSTTAHFAVPCDYMKKSSPLSGSSWPCYTKCYCQGELVPGERHAAATVGDLIIANE